MTYCLKGTFAVFIFWWRKGKLMDLFVVDHNTVIQLFEYGTMIIVTIKTFWIFNFHWCQLTKTNINIYASFHICSASQTTPLFNPMIKCYSL